MLLRPDDIRALSGLGYAHAWSGRYTEAESAFKRILDQDARNVEGRKGMGYVQLWRGRGEQAADWFGSLSAGHPGSEEYHLDLLPTGGKRALSPWAP
jgi:Flp pilus assembly protein TadD